MFAGIERGPSRRAAAAKMFLVARYHGWTYTLDGRLIGTPEVDGVEFFDRSTMGMVPVRCETWRQFIFVNSLQRGAIVRNIWAKFRNRRAVSYFRVETHRAARLHHRIATGRCMSTTISRAITFPIAHPGLMKEIDYPHYRSDTFRYHSQQFAPIRAVKPEERAERVLCAGRRAARSAVFLGFPQPDVEYLSGQPVHECDRAPVARQNADDFRMVLP